jgi:hypothetical protein
MQSSAEPADGVLATVEYVSAASRSNLRYVGDGREVNTGVFEPHQVFMRDARRAPAPMTLDTCGFELARHDSAVDFYDDAGAEAAYAAEIEPLLLALSGADRVVLFGARRRHLTRSQGEVLQAASDVHVDYAAEDSRRLAQALLGEEGRAGMPYRRYMAVNVWRALSPPPQDRPLAICDARSVATQSGVPNALVQVTAMPPREEMLSEPPEGSRNGFLFHFDPAHRWYYYPDMTPGEVVLFKLYDSLETGPWRCPHVSFADPTVKNAPPRESYEIRSFVYFR